MLRHIILCLLSLLLLIQCYKEPSKPPVRGDKQAALRGGALAHIHNMTQGYGTGTSRDIYKGWQRLGMNSVQLNTFAYMASKDAVDLSWNDPTLGESRLEQEIKDAKKHGYQVMLKPHIWLGTTSQGEWRNQIDFTDELKLNQWFANYAEFVLKQMRVAVANEVEFFVIGTELVKLTKYTKHWQHLIRLIRDAGYKGNLLYSCEAWNAYKIKFWSHLDFIGLNFYYGHKEPYTPASLAAFYAEKLSKHYQHGARVNRPIILTELGFPAHANAISTPHLWPRHNMSSSPEKQLLAYQSFRKALVKAGYPYGIYIWKYVTSLDSYEAKNYEQGFIVQDKPAESEIAQMFTAGSTPSPAAN